ncbi:hypothetical protein MIMGU_mgv1a018884mg [Erythranthe guttata]|uniref:RING-type domain-containing protein n=1 Tax=Erythranthe guttata TaxID=4155 RepID=A0A022RGZ5_ERYGU|nr:hypothetical protein MIMGU_mgv1a018884mg [Erythranthe guttata]
MSSPVNDTTCGICSGSLTGQAIFTAECSHPFHFGCISKNFTNGIRLPVCPLCPPPANPVSSTNVYHSPSSQSRQSRHWFHTAPSSISDDEPLPTTTADFTSPPSRRVNIKAVPERSAVAASDSVHPFTVLVGLKAPPLSADAISSQRAPIDLVTVFDVSGSMYGKKLSLLKRAVHFVIDNLGPSDRLSIVSFSSQARRIFRLTRMTDTGRYDAKLAVDSLSADGGTNIVEGLKKGSQVLEERRHENPVTSISYSCPTETTLATSNRLVGAYHVETVPVHSFGFGSDHDPITMHAISDASGGTFSFIESYETVQDAFASCIGGLLSVVAQGVRLSLRSASRGVEISSIPSGRYASEISSRGSKGVVDIVDLYADEEKEFLINLSVPALPNNKADKTERKTSLLDIDCSYTDVVSKEVIQIECRPVRIQRPKFLSSSDMTVNLEVDRQRNRLRAAESIAEAQQMAEAGNLIGARTLLAKRRTDLRASAAAQAGDDLSIRLETDMEETKTRMGSQQQYLRVGRAYSLSVKSSHSSQRKTSRGNTVRGADYETPSIANMVRKSRLLSIKNETSSEEE